MYEEASSYMENCRSISDYLHEDLYKSNMELNDLLHYLTDSPQEYQKYRLDTFAQYSLVDYKGMEDLCLEFLNLVNTDTTLRDMFYYGEEGVNFEYVDVDGKQMVHKINEDWPMAGYTNGTFFTVTPIETDTEGQWDEIKALNEAAVPSVMLGFNFDTTEVESQLANCREIWMRYRSEVMAGVNDPKEVVPKIKEELDKAGFQDVMAAAQAQVDEFMASK